MTSNLTLVVKKHFSSLYKDYRILKVSFTILTVYLLMYELYNYFVTRPTFQSVTQTEIGPGYFPDILLCPRESFNLDQLQQLGRNTKLHILSVRKYINKILTSFQVGVSLLTFSKKRSNIVRLLKNGIFKNTI